MTGGVSEELAAAGDQLFEIARRAVEEVLDEHGVFAVHEYEPGVVRPRREHMGETHPSNLPRRAAPLPGTSAP